MVHLGPEGYKERETSDALPLRKGTLSLRLTCLMEKNMACNLAKVTMTSADWLSLSAASGSQEKAENGKS